MSAAHGAAAFRPPAELVPALVRMADALAWPLLLVDEQGALQHANDSGRRLLAAGQPLRLEAGRRVQPASPSYRADFWMALQAAAAGQVCDLRWPGAPGGRTATLRPLALLPASGKLLLLELKPAFHAAPVRRPDVTAFARSQGLSTPQTQLLLALAEGRRVSQLAAELRLPPSTVRSRLVAVRRKTGHRRVDELLRTLWSLPPALAGDAVGK